MRGYRIVYSENHSYHFELIPSNNKCQRIGRSCSYKDISECHSAIKEFGSFVKLNGLHRVDDEKVVVKKNSADKFIYEYINKGQVIFYRDHGYDNKQSCVDIIEGIYKYIDDYTTIEVED